MARKRNNHDPKFKSRVALEAIRGIKTVSELSAQYGVHPTLINRWKKQVIESLPEVFESGKAPRKPAGESPEIGKLYEQIGRLQVELDWLKKKLNPCIEEKRLCIEPHHRRLSIRRQCALLGLSRASYYYEPRPERPENLVLMSEIDRIYLDFPYFGSRRMAAFLRDRGYAVNRKRIQRLMRLMALEAVYPKPRTSAANPAHRVYPYLLRDLTITHPNHVWSTDITYVPMRRGYMYLTAIIDWYSRYVVAWEISNTLDGAFCREVLRRALQNKKPSIFNTDQGAQFTSPKFTEILQEAEVQISMDGKGRALDNVFVERLWRSVKYEHIYLHSYENGLELYHGLHRYFEHYNNERPHQSLGNQKPSEVYHATEA
nr:IS3 family transposase [Sulfidibacter corallicola]